MHKQIKVFCLFGTRPEAIKMAPLVRGMRAKPNLYKPIVCVTGQHRHMLDQVLEAFEIVPDYDLSVMKDNQGLAGLTASILNGVDTLLKEVRPDLLIVQGDTTTAFAGALSAFYNHVPVAHVEAGLRTGDLQNPFPEEANRILVDHLSEICFAPTEFNRQSLLGDGVPAERIHVTGNTGVDALLWMREKVNKIDISSWEQLWGSAGTAVGDRSRPLVLITAHRRESFGARIEGMFSAIKQLAMRYPVWDFVYPVHLNPNVKEPAKLILTGVGNIHLIDPLPYAPFVYLMDRAFLILTDSGGIQEEAPSLSKPVIVMRDTTERQEAVEAGSVILAGTDPERFISIVEPFLSHPEETRKWKTDQNPYGDGRAAERILNILSSTNRSRVAA